MLASLGVSYVIAGDYSGWNFGLAHGGWGGLAGAVAYGAAMYWALLTTLAELASIVPEAGAGAAFAERALGPVAACLTGACVWIEYVAAAAVIAVFLQAYLHALVGVGGPPIIIGVFALFVAIHAAGVAEALRVLLALAVIALFGLAVFVVVTLPHFSPARLLELPSGAAPGAGRLLPFGWLGLWSALPFGTAFFLGVEGIAMAAEETRDAHRNLPRGMAAAFGVLLTFGVLLVLSGPGAAGTHRLEAAEDPMVVTLEAVRAAGSGRGMVVLVNACAVAGFLACMFSAIFAYSRLSFALARAGYLPRCLGVTSRRSVPVRAIVIPGLVACALALTGAAEQIFVLMVSAGTLSYLFMVPAHWILRARAPALHRPFRTPGGVLTSAYAWLASALSCIACFIANPGWSSVTLVVLALFLGGWWLRARNRRES